MSDMAIAHGMAEAQGESDVVEAHRRLLPKLGPIAHQLSEFTFGFAPAVFRKYVGEEISAVVAAKFIATFTRNHHCFRQKSLSQAYYFGDCLALQ